MSDSNSALLEPGLVTPSAKQVASASDDNHGHVAQLSPVFEPAPSWLDRGRIPGLDGIRAVAVLLVLLAHAVHTQGFPQWKWLGAIAAHGSLGVEIFFVLSGFLITTLLLREIERTETVDLRSFFLRRTLRIMPAYISLLIVLGMAQAVGLFHLAWRDWLAAGTYTVNFLHRPSWEIGHAWSLSIEEHFYLVWPVVLFACGTKHAVKTVLGCMTFCCLGRWVVLIWAPQYTPMAELWTFLRLDTIAAGCGLALLAKDTRRRHLLNRLTQPVALAAVFGLLVASLGMSSLSAKYAVGVAYSLNAVCICLLVWGAVRQGDNVCGGLLNHPWVMAIGVRSYSIYLWQQLFLNPYQTGLAYTFPLNLVLAVIVACLSYHFIEAPFLKLKTRVASGG